MWLVRLPVAKALSKSAGPRASTNYEIASPHARPPAVCVERRRHKPGFAIWLDLHPASLPVNPDQDSFFSGSGTLRPVIRPILMAPASRLCRTSGGAAPIAGREQAQPRTRSADTSVRDGWRESSRTELWAVVQLQPPE